MVSSSSSSSRVNLEDVYHAFEAISSSVLVMNPNGTLDYANQAACRMLGYGKMEMKDRCLADLGWEAYDEHGTLVSFEAFPMMRTWQEGGHIRKFPIHLVHPVRKRECWILVDANPLSGMTDGDGQKVAITIVDITEYRKVELDLASERNVIQHIQKDLIETETMYRSLVEESLVGVYLLTQEALLYVNPRFAEIFGYTREEILQLDFFSQIHPDDQATVMKSIKKRMHNEIRSARLQYRVRHKKGTWVEVEVHGTNTIYKGEPAIIGTLLDITERKKTEELFRRSDKLNIVGQLAAGVAHEIRNPLTTLRGFIQLFRSTLDAKTIDILLQEIDRINFIVSEFLVLSKPQAIYFAKNNPGRILESVISFLEPQAHLKNIEFKLDLVQELPEILCEENQLKQVFINILKNAIESMPKGGQIHVQARYIGEEILFGITDEGCGIPEHLLSKLGDPFFTTKPDGTGLGLMVSYRIIELHKGKIFFSSEPDKGTRVDIILPVLVDRERSDDRT